MLDVLSEKHQAGVSTKHKDICCPLNTVMKKMKHRIVEHMSSSTADALGLSRAILCNGEFYDLH